MPVVVTAVVGLAAVGGGLWWFLRDDAPPPVSLDAAVGEVSDRSTTSTVDGAADPDASGAPAADGIEGTWAVEGDGEVGFEDDESGSFAGVRIEEELSTIGSTTAVARTPDVTGSITIEGTTLTEASFEVDLTTITTNDRRRDDKVQSALETGEFPTATFTLTEPVELGDGAVDGGPITVEAPGELTVHGVTHPVTVPLEAQVVEGTVVVVGSVEIAFSEWDVEVPSSPIVLSVADVGTLEVQLLLERADRRVAAQPSGAGSSTTAVAFVSSLRLTREARPQALRRRWRMIRRRSRSVQPPHTPSFSR